MQKTYKRILAIAGAVVALATTACGSSVADPPGPTPSPVTADSVRAAIDSSNMKSAHFKLHGTLIKKPNYFPVTGDGIIQIAPREAFVMNLNIQTYTSLGVVKIHDVSIGGKDYTRVNNGVWTSKPTKNTPTKFTSYVGEETLAGTTVWHARAATGGSSYDVWVRESDGYMVQLALSGASGNFTMTFDSYNKSPLVKVP